MKRSVDSIDEKILRKVYDDNSGIALYEFLPTLLSPFYCEMEPLKFVRRVRLLDEYLRGGYKVYYLAVDGMLIGYNVLTQGGRRLSYSSKNDIVSGPAYIAPQHRCKGYNKLMKRLSFSYCSFDYEFIYNWVDKTNIPSIKSIEKMGFERVAEINVLGLSHKLVPSENGTCIVYRLAKMNV